MNFTDKISNRFTYTRLYDNCNLSRHRSRCPYVTGEKVPRLDSPPCSPDLNPIERVWKYIRRLCTIDRYFCVRNEPVFTITSRFSLWQKPN
jgi:hypothetical protein